MAQKCSATFCLTEKAVIQTLSLLECMIFSEKYNLSPALSNDLPHDDVPVQLHRQPRRLCCLDFIPEDFKSIHPWRDRIMWWVLPAKRLLYIFHNFTNSREVDPLLELVK